MIDLNSVDNTSHSTIVGSDDESFDREVFLNLNELIESQYVDLDDLGHDKLYNITDQYKLPIYESMLEYINENYVSIINIDQTKISSLKRLEVGYYVYKFFCVDCFNIILPHYLSSIKCSNVYEFEGYFQNVLRNDSTRFKTNFIKSIIAILNNLKNLEKLDKSVLSDKNFIDLKTRIGYYIELVNYGDSSDLLINFLLPVLEKHEPEIIWRML